MNEVKADFENLIEQQANNDEESEIEEIHEIG